MAFVVSFINDIKTILIAKLIENRVIRIMTGANCVNIVRLHHQQIFFHLRNTDCKAGEWIGLMAIDTTEFNRLTIQPDDTINNGNLTNADAIADYLIWRSQHKCIKIWCFSSPKFGRRQRKHYLHRVCAVIRRLCCAGTHKHMAWCVQICTDRKQISIDVQTHLHICSIRPELCMNKVVVNAPFRAF